MGNDTELKVLENQNKILSAMYEEELTNEKKFSGADKKEIAETVQLQTSDVSDVIHKYQQMKGFHGFLKERRANNQPMPESQEDLMMIYRMERPKFLMSQPNKWKQHAPKVRYQNMYSKHT